jgi:hypothetical protein
MEKLGVSDMMRNRHRLLLAQLGGSASNFAIPTYSGSHAIFGNEKQGYIECYSTGEITFPKAGKVDVFILGSGLKGATGVTAGDYQAQGGKGGKGGIGQTLTGIDVEGTYSITVAAACTSTATANKSTAFETTANSTRDNGGKGAASTISGNSGSSSNANNGTNGTSYPFSATSGVFYKQLGAGGGGGGTYWANSSNGYVAGQGNRGNGGTLGGGAGCSGTAAAGAGSANTGSGGGGGYASVSLDSSGNYGTPTTMKGGNGGSGIVIIRWGYAA